MSNGGSDSKTGGSIPRSAAGTRRPANGDGRRRLVQELGNDRPLLGGSLRRKPEMRRVSYRWMCGSVLTGLTSVLLMGGALHATLDGRQQLARPASVYSGMDIARNDAGSVRGDKPETIVAIAPAAERVLQVATVTRDGDRSVIRKRPFAYASAPLAIAAGQDLDYPRFDPLSVFRAAKKDKKVPANEEVIYGADIESDVRIQRRAFDTARARFDESVAITQSEAERIARAEREQLEEGDTRIAALPYMDPTRFALDQLEVAPPSTLDIVVEAQNVSHVLSLDPPGETDRGFREEVVKVRDGERFEPVLADFGFEPEAQKGMIAALEGEFGRDGLPSGTKLRVSWEQALNDDGDVVRIPRRIAVYRGGSHMKSVALDDSKSVVWAVEPVAIPAVAADEVKPAAIQTVASSKLPNVYDGIYRAALSQGLNLEQTRRIIRTVAFDVDFRSRISAKDSLEIFYSLPDGGTEVSLESEVLYVGLELGKSRRDYYRFRSDDGTVDYYDREGKSSRKFLLRKPVPNGKFRSPFGMRRHPISRVRKMHNGVDWSAPRGTKILAAGNGVVVKAGWAGGYGRQVVIRHANGYRSSYSHMHRIRRGMKPGARVRQGQIIGTVGSTGYSTGPHLHYEVSVNKRKVNPMKIRLPKGKSLKGGTLRAFKRERDRIDDLLDRARGTDDQKVAALN